MTQSPSSFRFIATVHSPAKEPRADWLFVVLPTEVSATLTRRGRISVDVVLNEQRVTVRLEPDGQLSHWMKIHGAFAKSAGVEAGEEVTIEMTPLSQEPEPTMPDDLHAALSAAPAAKAVWDATTVLARVDWIHWIESAEQQKTRQRRIGNACDMLAEGKKRVCCFDVSGHYSKAFAPPQAKE